MQKGSVKILHTGDLHLGASFAGTYFPTELARQRREELKETFLEIIDLAERYRVDVLLCAGDLFEYRFASKALMRFLNDAFMRLTKTRIFIAPGNHDPALRNSYYRNFDWASNVHIFINGWEKVDLSNLPVSVYGCGFDQWIEEERKLQSLLIEDANRINLVLLHGTDLTTIPEKRSEYLPFTLDDLRACGADYYALGHYHRYRHVLEENGRIIAAYCGSPEPLGFDEPGEHGIIFGTVAKHATDLQFIRLNRRSYFTQELDVTGAVSPEEIIQTMKKIDVPEELGKNFYRIKLTGAVDPELTVDPAAITAQLGGVFHFLQLENHTFPEYDLNQYTDTRTARGLFVQRMQELIAAEVDSERRTMLEKALYYGLDAFNQKKVIER